MANNLHISYELNAPTRNQEAVIQEIKKLGNWAKIASNCWYVKSPLDAMQAVDAVSDVMEPKDSIYVVDSSHDESAWRNIPEKVSALIRDQWSKYTELSVR